MVVFVCDVGFQKVEVFQILGYFGVFVIFDVGVKWMMGIYFMYDVKQYDFVEWLLLLLEVWIVDKFGYGKVIVGCGVINQKGLEVMFFLVFYVFCVLGIKLFVNLVLIVEGEEEIGLFNFKELVIKLQVLVVFCKCEGIVILLGWQDKQGNVDVNFGVKGIIEFELIVSGKKWGCGFVKDLYLSYKVMVDLLSWWLIQVLQMLVSVDGNMLVIDGWFENVWFLLVCEKVLIVENVKILNEVEMKIMLGVLYWIDDLLFFVVFEWLVLQLIINIEGLVVGYIGFGGKMVLFVCVVVKIDCCLVFNQICVEVMKKFCVYFDKCGFIDIEVNVLGGYDLIEMAEDS